MTRTAEIRAAILRRYPCQEMPHGAMTTLAAEFGVSRELVRQIASSLNTVAQQRWATVRVCICGQPVNNSNKSGIHSECRWIELPCAECGAPVRRRPAQLANRHNTGRYSGRVFCNRTCFGRYAGREFGTSNPNHPVHQQKGADAINTSAPATPSL